MIRFTYLIPRIIIIALIALALIAGSDPLIRNIVTSRLERAIGAKVEIGQLRSSLGDQKIFLKDIAITDARFPMQNMVQAELAYAEFDLQSLLFRHVVIEKSQMSGVMFGTPRSQSGQLDPNMTLEEQPAWKPKTFESVEEISQHWLDGLSNNVQVNGNIDYELNQTIEKINQFWAPEFKQLSSLIKTLQQDNAAVRTAASSVQTDTTNTLRTKYVNLDDKFKAIANRTQQIQTRLFELQQVAAENRDSLTLAHQRDIQKLRQSIEIPTFDSNAISQLLLTKVQENQVNEIIRWFHWFRSAIPDCDKDAQASHERGQDLLLPKKAPDFLIKSIELEGEGRFASRHFNFAGSAENVTLQPKRHDQPTSIELRAQGDQHVVVFCTLDRRADEPIDKLKVLCPDLELDSQLLGDAESMLVTMGSGNRMQADIQIQANGEKISGELVFRHSNVALHVDELHDMAGGKPVALQMNQGLLDVDRFESRVTLSGTFDDYQYNFTSDLGSRFSSSVNKVLTQKGKIRIAEHKQKLDEQLATQLKVLDTQVVQQIQQLSQILRAESNELAALQKNQPDNTGSLRKLR